MTSTPAHPTASLPPLRLASRELLADPTYARLRATAPTTLADDPDYVRGLKALPVRVTKG